MLSPTVSRAVLSFFRSLVHIHLGAHNLFCSVFDEGELAYFQGGDGAVKRLGLVVFIQDSLQLCRDFLGRKSFGFHDIGIRIDACAKSVFLAADDDLADQVMGQQSILDFLGRDIFPVAEDDEVLQAAGDVLGIL